MKPVGCWVRSRSRRQARPLGGGGKPVLSYKREHGAEACKLVRKAANDRGVSRCADAVLRAFARRYGHSRFSVGHCAACGSLFGLSFLALPSLPVFGGYPIVLISQGHRAAEGALS